MGSSSPNPDSASPAGSSPTPLAPILNRTLPGGCHPQNRGSLVWGPDGLLAFGSHSSLVVVDPVTVQVVQVLTRHRATVVSADWGGRDERRLQLASADAAGQIISWDVSSGDHVRQVHDGNQPVAALKWLNSEDQLLLAVHPPNHLVLWNMDSGTKVWKKSYGDTILGLDLDPFLETNLLMRCEHSFLLVTDLSHTKCPKTEGRKWSTVETKGTSPEQGGQGAGGGRGTKLRRMVRSMVLGEAGGVVGQQAEANDCLQAVYHRAVRNLVVLAYKKEVLLVDTQLSQTVGLINLERAHSSLAGVCVARQREVVYLLHESGSVSVWTAKSGLTVAATPQLSKSQSLSLFPNTPLNIATPMSEALLELTYESKATSDHVRLGKNCRVLGLAVHPVTQTEASFITTDGRMFVMHLRPQTPSNPAPPVLSLSSLPLTTSLRLTVSAILSSLSSCLVRMCPPLTMKNWPDYQPLLAVGNQAGHLLVVNVSSGHLVRELAVHTSAVQGLEWTSGNPAASVLSFAHCPVTGSSGLLVRNELVHTDIRTGKVKHIRSLPGREAEEPKITMIRVSQLKQYFVVAFAAAPFELWDLKNLCVLRTMPKKFPPISALEWSPLHTSKVKRNKGGSTSPSSQGEAAGVREESNSPMGGRTNKEHILLTDLDGQLYHFTVEGHSIKDGTKIPAETGLGTINSICWKSDLIVRGDSEGNINIWNVKTRQSKNIHTGRGAIRRMRFSPGKSNMKILAMFQDGVQIWDVKELELINELRSPVDCVPVEDVEWASSDRVVLAGQDGALRMAGLALAGTTSPCLTYGRDQPPACLGLLPPHKFQLVAFSLGYRPWQAGEVSLSDVLHTSLSEDEADLVDTCLEYLGEGFEDVVRDKQDMSLVQRYHAVALVLGLTEEAELWQMLSELERGCELGPQFDVLVGDQVFRTRAEELCRLHLNRAVERVDRVRVTAQLICLGLLEPAVALLLDSDSEDPSYMADQLLACLIQANVNSDATGHVSTMKMVATNLLSEGRLWEGVQLLVLAGKVFDACSYLRSAGHWDEALWLARCRLDEEQFRALAIKYSEHLGSQGLVKEAAMTLMSVGCTQETVEVLHVAQRRSLAAKLLPLLQGGEEDNVGWVLQEAVMMETARLMKELGNSEAALYYCDMLGEKGRELVSEFSSVEKL